MRRALLFLTILSSTAPAIDLNRDFFKCGAPTAGFEEWSEFNERLGKLDRFLGEVVEAYDALTHLERGRTERAALIADSAAPQARLRLRDFLRWGRESMFPLLVRRPFLKEILSINLGEFIEKRRDYLGRKLKSLYRSRTAFLEQIDELDGELESATYPSQINPLREHKAKCEDFLGADSYQIDHLEAEQRRLEPLEELLEDLWVLDTFAPAV